MKTDFTVCFDSITKTIITDVSVRRSDVSNAVNNTVSADYHSRFVGYRRRNVGSK